MPIELSNQEINAALLEYDDGLFLAALVGTVTADAERGFDLNIETVEKLRETLQRIHGLLEPEIDPHVIRPLLEWWSPALVELFLPVGGPLDFSRKILLKVRSWKLLYDSGNVGDNARVSLLFDPPDDDDVARGYPRRR